MTELPAQRLWVLERDVEFSPREGGHVCRFVGAVVMADAAVYVVFVRSPEPQRADAIANNVNVVVGFKNVTDDDYQLAWGFPQPGRKVYVKTRIGL